MDRPESGAVTLIAFNSKESFASGSAKCPWAILSVAA